MEDDKPKENLNIVALKEIFLKNYSPGKCGEENISFMSTNEIHSSFLRLYPNKQFKPEIVFEWLLQEKFECIDVGNMNLQWVIKRN